jgi:2-C-methyl-D-erythritol 4-phosphate cytidylyltransferase
MNPPDDPWAILVAAGLGERFGRPKHAAELAGEPLWVRADRTLRAAGVADVVVVGDVDGGVPGGPRRRDSVLNGLDRVPAGVEFVVVHDAARPLASVDLIRRVIDRLAAGDVAGVVPAVPLRDTVKETIGDIVVGTVDRSRLVAVQTPQGFVVSVLRKAHAAGDEDASDDATLLQAIGEQVVTVPGDPGNLKITYPEDVAVAAAMLAGADG